MERRSSKGNPWHDAKGRFCHGPTATVDTFGNPITEEQRKESVLRSQQSKEYYDAKTRYRNGEISEEMFKELVSKRATDTPSYDLFIESLPQRPDVSTPKKREALFREIAEKSGSRVDVPVRATKGKMRQGSVQFGAQPNGDNCTKSATKVTLSGAMSEDEERVETIYHEAYHFSANGGESDEYGYPYGRFERRRESCNMEEDVKTILEALAAVHHLSGRGIIRTLRVARAIADLEQSFSVEREHLEEAVMFRVRTGDGT